MRFRPACRLLRRGLLLLFAAWAGIALWHVLKPLPEGVRVAGPMVATPADDLRFLADVTSADIAGEPQQRHQIHAATLELVRDARGFLLLDYFLFNGQGGPAGPLRYERGLSPVSRELIETIRGLKAAQPELPVLVIVDPINDYYRGSAPPVLASLRDIGIDVVVTRLDPLRDSNPVYGGLWRLLFKWWAPNAGDGRLRNALDGAGPPVKLGALLRLPNFKANHRKLALTGDGAGSLLGIVASANPHDASSAHSNVALRVAGEALRPLLASELAVARFSGWNGTAFDRFAQPAAAVQTGEARVGIVTEGAIRDAVLARLASAGPGDAIDLAQFYLSERRVIGALLDAARRGAAVRVLLDPNRDAFGFEKSGIPNRQVAHELVSESGGAIRLRWYRTHGEQFHSKLAAVRGGDRLWFTLGSANFTRRNIADYNLEANVVVDAPADAAVARDVAGWFEQLWSNGGAEYTDDTDTWIEAGLGRYWQYRFMEATGMSTF